MQFSRLQIFAFAFCQITRRCYSGDEFKHWKWNYWIRFNSNAQPHHIKISSQNRLCTFFPCCLSSNIFYLSITQSRLLVFHKFYFCFHFRLLFFLRFPLCVWHSFWCRWWLIVLPPHTTQHWKSTRLLLIWVCREAAPGRKEEKGEKKNCLLGVKKKVVSFNNVLKQAIQHEYELYVLLLDVPNILDVKKKSLKCS